MGTLELHGKPISTADYSFLIRSDTIGDRPDLEKSPILMELNSLIGLQKVKDAVQGLMYLQLQNFDNEMKGEKVKLISLHRLFLGNPGTGELCTRSNQNSILTNTFAIFFQEKLPWLDCMDDCSRNLASCLMEIWWK